MEEARNKAIMEDGTSVLLNRYHTREKELNEKGRWQAMRKVVLSSKTFVPLLKPKVESVLTGSHINYVAIFRPPNNTDRYSYLNSYHSYKKDEEPSQARSFITHFFCDFTLPTTKRIRESLYFKKIDIKAHLIRAGLVEKCKDDSAIFDSFGRECRKVLKPIRVEKAKKSFNLIARDMKNYTLAEQYIKKDFTVPCLFPDDSRTIFFMSLEGIRIHKQEYTRPGSGNVYYDENLLEPKNIENESHVFL